VNDADEEGMTPLGAAVVQNFGEVARQLLKSQADPMRAQPFTKRTAAHLGAAAGCKEGLAPLLELGDELLQQSDLDGHTCADVAFMGGHLELLKMLADAGAKFSSQASSAFRQILEQQQELTDELSTTLVKVGADLDAADENGRTALFVAIGQENPATVEVLLKMKASPNKTRFAGGESPLHAATSAEIVKILAGFKADVNARDRYMKSPLHIAVERNDQHLLLALLSIAGVEQGLRDDRDRTALDLAKENSGTSVAVVNLLGHKYG